MTLIKKFSAPLIAVALVASMAIGLLGEQRVANATTVASATATAPVQAAGLVETWTVNYVGSGAGAVTSSVITFPATFNVPGTIATTAVTVTCNVTASAVSAVAVLGQVVTVTHAACADSSAGAGVTVTIAGITNTTTTGTTGNFSASSNFDTTAATATAVIWNTTATKSPTTSVAADGASTVQVTFAVSHTAANTGTTALIITGTTDVGTFSVTPTQNGAFFQSATAVTTPVTTVTTSLAATLTAATDALVVTVKAPTTAGTSTVILRATPATGGQAVIIGSTTITWTTATPLPGATASLTITPAATTVLNTAANNVVVTATDANGTAVLNGTAITLTTTNGTFTTCPGGTFGSGVCVATVQAAGAVTVTITGSGVSGTQTIQGTVGSVTRTATVTLFGAATTLELSGRRSDTATSFVAKGVVRNSDSSTTGDDEIIIAAVAKDANGTAIGAGNVVFTLTGPAGHTVGFFAAAETSGLTVTSPSCGGGGGGGTNTCTSAITAAAAGATTPSHASGYIDIDSSTGEPLGTYTVTATILGANNATITGTMTFTLAKAPATLTIGDIPLIGLGESKAVTITCKDTDGNPCASGTALTVTVSNANLVAQTTAGATAGQVFPTTNDAGVATINLIGLTAGTTNVVANVGTVTAVKLATVGTTPVTPPPATGGVFTGTIAPTGLTIVSFTGTNAQLSTAGAAAKVITASATTGGKLYTFVIGAPDFVNVEFVAAFPTHTGTLVIVKTGS